jgi:endonuclease/exonuclease/phosphatase family metal-dependent hydrolase
MNRGDRLKSLLTALCLVVLLPWLALADEQVVVAGWNVESGDATVNAVADRIAGFSDVDIWGLCEVYSSRAGDYEQAAEDGEGADFGRVQGSNVSFGIRLLILYDNDRFELIAYEELHAINVSGTVRPPLVAHLRIRSSGDEFKFMVNHLYRGSEAGRIQQSTMLNDWAENETLPVIAVGDYNYDWRVVGGETDHDVGYDRITEDDVFEWLRPTMLSETQYSPSYDPAVLDFVFLANDEGAVSGTSEIIVEPDDFPDDHTTSDHRPIMATLILGPSGDPGVSLKEQLLARIAELEQELAELRQLVNQLPE